MIDYQKLYHFHQQTQTSLCHQQKHHYNKKRFQLAEDEFKNILIDKRNFEDPVSHFMLAKTQYNLNYLLID